MGNLVARARAFAMTHKKKLISLLIIIVGGFALAKYAKKALSDWMRESVAAATASMRDVKRRQSESARLKTEANKTLASFIGPVRRHLNRLTDSSDVTSKLKAVRAKTKGRQPTKEEAKEIDDLWEELKVISISRLASSVYALVALNLLLRVQLFVAARTLLDDAKSAESSGKKAEDVLTPKVREQFMFKTTDFFVAHGLTLLLTRVMRGVRISTKAWNMGTDATVTREEIQTVTKSLRKEVEVGSEASSEEGFKATQMWFLSCLIQPDEALARAKEDAGFQGPQADALKALLDETMDVMESPLFGAALEAALTTCFDVLLEELHSRNFEVRKDGASSQATPSQSTSTTPTNVVINEASALTTETTDATLRVPEKFILAKVIVGMKLMSRHVLGATPADLLQDHGESGSSTAVVAASSTNGEGESVLDPAAQLLETNRYVREMQSVPQIESLCKAIIGLDATSEAGGLEALLGGAGQGGAGGGDMQELTRLLESLGGGGGGGEAGGGLLGGLSPDDMRQMQEMLASMGAGGAGPRSAPPAQLPPASG